LFSILGSLLGNLDGLRVLDICAGAGSLGIEALSRGAKSALFIDNHHESARLVAKNLALSGLAMRGIILEKDAISALDALAVREPPFNLVFLDPPYRQGLAERILWQLSTSPLVDSSTLVVAEIEAREELPTDIGPLVQFDRRIYGDTAIVFFEKRPIV
jgi:16S rRNA (guanine(966)-N(2))-methyltransferase RsmD